MPSSVYAIAKEVPGPDGKLVANPNKNWSDIDKSLPNTKIEVLGPPPTSGTRDALHELLLEKGAEQIPALAALKKSDAQGVRAGLEVAARGWRLCRGRRERQRDRPEARRQQELRSASSASRSSRRTPPSCAACRSTASSPTYDNIASGKYKGSRLLYVYVKKQHVGVVPGIDKFVAEYVSPKAIGEDGYLAKKGLVTLPKAEAEKVRKSVRGMTPMTADPLS